MIPRSSRRGGVLPNTFKAPLRRMAYGSPMLPASYSKMVGVPICMGENDIHNDCVTVAAYNVAANINARLGIFTPFADVEPFQLFETLGGMPLDEGLDPATLFNYWLKTPIAGYLLKDISEIALDDTANIKQAIIDNGFVYATAALTEAQMTQDVWSATGGPITGYHAFVPSWYEGDYLHDFTWSEDIPMQWDFLSAQGQNIWRLEVEKA
jgi:hypothetical protein